MSRIPIFLGTAVSSWSVTDMTLEFGALVVTTFKTVSGGERVVITSAATTIAGGGRVGAGVGLSMPTMPRFGRVYKLLFHGSKPCLSIQKNGAIG